MDNPLPTAKSQNNNENYIILLDSQSNTILHQFSVMAGELKNFTKQVSNIIIKMTQAHNTTQDHTGKLIENAISKALSKTQDTTVSLPTTVNTSTRNITYASPTYDSHQTSSWPPSQPAISHTPHINTHPTYRHKESQNKHIN